MISSEHLWQLAYTPEKEIRHDEGKSVRLLIQ